MENSKRGNVTMQVKLNLSKAQSKNTLDEVKCMQRVPYALAIGSIMHAQNPGKAHWTVVKTILKYLRNIKDMVIVWGNPKNELKKSAKKSNIAMYSIEAKYIAATEASMETVWMRKFIDVLGNIVPTNKRHMEMLCDNTGAIAIVHDPIIMKGAKHFQRKYL
ncbi:hypothetical protein Tco_0087537 [Tanacetum coccineum]